AGTAATQPLSGRARSRQALRLVPLRAKPEAALLRWLTCRYRHRATAVYRRAQRKRITVRLQGHRRPALLRRLAPPAVILGARQCASRWTPLPLIAMKERSRQRPLPRADTLAPDRGEGGQRRPWLISCNSWSTGSRSARSTA